jgi:hypothetical protein
VTGALVVEVARRPKLTGLHVDPWGKRERERERERERGKRERDRERERERGKREREMWLVGVVA